MHRTLEDNGVSGGSNDIVEVAASQIGNIGGEIYWKWYGFDTYVEWCACFVSWAADQCGYIDAGIILSLQLVTLAGSAIKDNFRIETTFQIPET